MTITLQPEQEKAIASAIRRGAIRSVDDFINAAIAALPAEKIPSSSPRKSRLWELRQGLTLGNVTIKSLIEEGRE